MLGLLRPLWSSDSEAHVQTAPLTVSPGPCRTRSWPSGRPASHSSTLATQVPGQCVVIPIITPPPKCAKSISQKQKDSILANHLRALCFPQKFVRPYILLYFFLLLPFGVASKISELFLLQPPVDRHPPASVLSPFPTCVYKWFETFKMSAVSLLLLKQDPAFCHTRPVFIYYLYFRAPQDTYWGWWNDIKQSWRLWQIVHNHGGKLGRGAEKGRDELMVKCVCECFCVRLAFLDVVNCLKFCMPNSKEVK